MTESEAHAHVSQSRRLCLSHAMPLRTSIPPAEPLALAAFRVRCNRRTAEGSAAVMRGVHSGQRWQTFTGKESQQSRPSAHLTEKAREKPAKARAPDKTAHHTGKRVREKAAEPRRYLCEAVHQDPAQHLAVDGRDACDAFRLPDVAPHLTLDPFKLVQPLHLPTTPQILSFNSFRSRQSNKLGAGGPSAVRRGW